MGTGRFYQAIVILIMAALLPGCAEKSGEPEPEESMQVSVDFREIHLCSKISPEITVAYAPRGTKFYDVRLMEEGSGERYLGGGSWQEDGTGLIPEGALTRHYTGPCPPKDRRVQYVYAITAMESEYGQPLETRLYRFTPDF